MLPIKTPAQLDQPDLSETTTLQEKKPEVVSKAVKEPLVETREVTGEVLPVANLEVMEHPINVPPSRDYGFTYSKTYRDYRFHKGVDFTAAGGTPVQAVMAGRVDSVDYSLEEGYKIVVDNGSGWKTVYSHVGDVQVAKGQKVGPGDTLAVVAAPGSKESVLGPHLHFELLYKDKNQNPLDYLPAPEVR